MGLISKWGKMQGPDNRKPTHRYDGRSLKNVHDFIFLRSVVPGTNADVTRRITLASVAFRNLQESVWRNRDIPRDRKVRLYQSLIPPIAVYASETWTLRQVEENMLNTFEMSCLIFRVTLRDRVKPKYKESTIRHKENYPAYYWHVARKPIGDLVYCAYSGDFQDKRSKGRPPKRWKDHSN